MKIVVEVVRWKGSPDLAAMIQCTTKARRWSGLIAGVAQTMEGCRDLGGEGLVCSCAKEAAIEAGVRDKDGRSKRMEGYEHKPS